MPLMPCSVDKEKGWKWGESGHCYTGKSAKALARNQGRAIKASQAKEKRRRTSK